MCVPRDFRKIDIFNKGRLLITLITRYYCVHSIPTYDVYIYMCVRECVFARIRFEGEVIEPGHLPMHLRPHRDLISRLLPHVRISRKYIITISHADVITDMRVYTGKGGGEIQGNCGGISKKRSKTVRKVDGTRSSLSYLSACLFLRCIVICIISYPEWIYVSYQQKRFDSTALFPCVKLRKHAEMHRRILRNWKK